MHHLFQRFVRYILVPECASSRPQPCFQIKALEHDVHSTLAVLRRYINPLESPLYRLPPDLFPEVASNLASETDLINATRVSHHLRNTLLSCPSLWSHLDFEHELRARAFFERSGQAPLHVDMVMDTARTVDSLPQLRQQSNRIATLKLGHWLIQKEFLSEPLPSLRRLKVSFEHCYDDALDEEWDTTWAPVWGLRKEAISWSFPSLTSLIIYNLSPIPFSTPSLTCFKFWDRKREGLTDADKLKLITFIDNCPLLEHIDISYVDRLPIRHDLVVSLPHLRTYTQTTFANVCFLTVLNALSLPPSCSITLRFRNEDETAAAVDGMLSRLENPDYLVGINRIKLRTTHDDIGSEVAGMLELINTKGMKLCSERMGSEGKDYRSFVQGRKDYAYNMAHLNSLRKLDGRSVETLCIDGCASQDIMGVAVEFLEEALGFGNVRTLIQSSSAAGPCLSALNEDPGASGHSRWFSPIYTLIIYPSRYHFATKVLRPLLSVARKRKAAGFPFRSVLLFIRDPPGWHQNTTLKELRRCVEKLEVFGGDKVLDWDVDKYFLDGLEHQKSRDVQWN